MNTNDQKTPNWLFNKWNFIILGFWILILLCGSYFTYQASQLKSQDANVVKDLNQWQNKLNKLVAKNNQIHYFPKSGDLQLSEAQSNAVSNLTNLFSQITTFNNATGYSTNYNLAKSSIHDSQFYKDFMMTTSQITSLNLKYKNIRTQVLVTGPITYQVFVTYIPYHNNSDLYQESQLQTVTKVFNVKGVVNNYSQVRLDPSILTNTTIVKAGQIE